MNPSKAQEPSLLSHPCALYCSDFGHIKQAFIFLSELGNSVPQAGADTTRLLGSQG